MQIALSIAPQTVTQSLILSISCFQNPLETLSQVKNPYGDGGASAATVKS